MLPTLPRDCPTSYSPRPGDGAVRAYCIPPCSAGPRASTPWPDAWTSAGRCSTGTGTRARASSSSSSRTPVPLTLHRSRWEWPTRSIRPTTQDCSTTARSRAAPRCWSAGIRPGWSRSLWRTRTPRARAWPGPARRAPWWSWTAGLARLPWCSTPRSPATWAPRTSAPWSARSGSALADGDVAAAAVDDDLVGGRRADQRLRVADVAALAIWGGDVVRGAAQRQDHGDVAPFRDDLQVLRNLGQRQGHVATAGVNAGQRRRYAAGVDVAALRGDLEGAGQPVGGQVAATGIELQVTRQVSGVHVAAGRRQRYAAGEAGCRDVAAVAPQGDRGSRRDVEGGAHLAVGIDPVAVHADVGTGRRVALADARTDETVLDGSGQPCGAAARGLLQRDVTGVDVHRHLAVLHGDRVTERIAPPGDGGDEVEAGPADQGQGHRHADRQGHPAAGRHEQGPQRAAGFGRGDRGLAGGGHKGHRDTPFIRCRGSAARRARDGGRGRRAPVRVW